MAAISWQLNRFERFLFRAAIVLAVALVLTRIGAMLLITILRHLR